MPWLDLWYVIVVLLVSGHAHYTSPERFSVQKQFKNILNVVKSFMLYCWHKTKHLVLPMTKVIRSDGLTLNTLILVYHAYIFPVGMRNFGILERIY